MRPSDARARGPAGLLPTPDPRPPPGLPSPQQDAASRRVREDARPTFHGSVWGRRVAGTPSLPAAPGRPGCQGGGMSHPDPSLVDVRTFADHPLVDNGPMSTLRMVAPGGITRGRYGLLEYRVAPRSAGAAPHYHSTFSESFYVLTGTLTIYADGSWQPYRPGDYALVHESGVHGFRNDGDEEASFLILFAPGIARENFFAEMTELRRTGRELTVEERPAFYARHDQVMVDI